MTLETEDDTSIKLVRKSKGQQIASNSDYIAAFKIYYIL